MLAAVAPAVLLTQGGGHGHVLTVGVTIGPVVLRVALLLAIPAVAGFAVLRGFLPDPDRRTLTAVIVTAGSAVSLVLLLSGGLNFSARLVPVVLLAVIVPLYLVRSRDPRFAHAVDLVRRCAPWVFWPATGLAVMLFAQARFAAAGPERTATLLHTGVVLALVALAWFTAARPRRTGNGNGVGMQQYAAVALAIVLMAGGAQATVLRLGEQVAVTPTGSATAP